MARSRLGWLGGFAKVAYPKSTDDCCDALSLLPCGVSVLRVRFAEQALGLVLFELFWRQAPLAMAAVVVSPDGLVQGRLAVRGVPSKRGVRRPSTHRTAFRFTWCPNTMVVNGSDPRLVCVKLSVCTEIASPARVSTLLCMWRLW